MSDILQTTSKPFKKDLKSDKAIAYSTLIGSLSSFTFGLALTCIECIEVFKECKNTSTSYMPPCIHLSDLKWSAIVAVICFGGLIGNLVTPCIPISLKSMIGLINMLYLVGFIFKFICTNFLMLFAGRFVLGVGVGINCAILPKYLGSIAPIEYRGMISACHQFGISLGIVVGQVLGCIFYKESNWRWGFGLIIGFLLIHTICIPFIIDVKQRKEGKSIKELLNLTAAKQSIITAIVFHLGQQLSCITGVLIFSNDILAKTVDKPRLYTIMIGVVSLISNLIAMGVVDRFGRKSLLLFSCVMVIAGLCTLLSKYVISALVVFMFGYALGLGPVTWVVTAEVFKEEYQAAGIMLAMSVNWLSNGIVTFTFSSLKALMDMKVFILYSIFVGIIATYILFRFKETRGKEPNFQ